MKTLASPSFFRLFDQLISTTNRDLKLLRWIHDGVEFERARHSNMGSNHSLAIEIFTLTRTGRRGWTLMVIKEYWWSGKESKPLKDLRWARITGGQRADVFTWLRGQEVALERTSSVGRQRATDAARVADEEDATEVETLQKARRARAAE
jgi:hypothetical protein